MTHVQARSDRDGFPCGRSRWGSGIGYGPITREATGSCLSRLCWGAESSRAEKLHRIQQRSLRLRQGARQRQEAKQGFLCERRILAGTFAVFYSRSTQVARLTRRRTDRHSRHHVVQTAFSTSADRQRSILASAGETLVSPPRALRAFQARFTFSRMSRALAVHMYGLGWRLWCSI